MIRDFYNQLPAAFRTIVSFCVTILLCYLFLWIIAWLLHWSAKYGPLPWP